MLSEFSISKLIKIVIVLINDNFNFDMSYFGALFWYLTTPVGLTAVTPTDRSKSVRNHCVIEVFGGVFIRLSSDGTYYGMVMSVRPTLRPGLRPPVFHFFLIHALTN